MLTLIIPGLLRLPEENVPPLSLPALDQLRRFATFVPHARTRSQLYTEFLCDQLELDAQQCYASPVVQQMGINNVQMLDVQAACIALDMAQAQHWCERINAFYQTDLRIEPVRADLWRMTLPQSAQWSVPPLWEACGILTMQPHDHAPQWLQLSTELQMWLHQQNHVPFNALWLWNAPEIGAQAACTLLGTNSVWAAQSSLRCETLPYDLAAWLRACQEYAVCVDETHLFDDGLVASAQTGDVWAYQQYIQQLEQCFFMPIWQALCAGSLRGVRVVCEQGEWRIKGKPPRWAFWKRVVPFDGVHS